MKKITKIVAVIMLLVFGIHRSYLFILPNITLINNTVNRIDTAIVTLPNSRIDFGEIKSSKRNTIYYNLAQGDGEYQYHIVSKDKVLKGACGYVTKSEYHKRLILMVQQDLTIICLNNK